MEEPVEVKTFVGCGVEGTREVKNLRRIEGWGTRSDEEEENN